MKKLLFLVSIVFLFYGCEKSQVNRTDSDYIARIAGFDLNCSTCILEFPDNNSQIIKEIGESPDNYYQTINLNKANYETGQLVRVKIRKAEPDELKACITLYPSYSYKNVFITEFSDFDNLKNDTIYLSYRDCLYVPENRFYICLDSVLNDSRCPAGAICIWEGNAEVRFKFEKLNEDPIFFNLNTHRSFTTDTIIDGYKFTLLGLGLSSLEHRVSQKDYKAKLLVQKNL
jgi:hypothetical protein